LKDNKQNNIFVLGHYLFFEVHRGKNFWFD